MIWQDKIIELGGLITGIFILILELKNEFKNKDNLELNLISGKILPGNISVIECIIRNIGDRGFTITALCAKINNDQYEKYSYNPSIFIRSPGFPLYLNSGEESKVIIPIEKLDLLKTKYLFLCGSGKEIKFSIKQLNKIKKELANN